MELRKIRQLVELLQKTGIAEIEIHEGNESVRILCDNKSTSIIPTDPIPATPIAPKQSTEIPEEKPAESIITKVSDEHTICSPMVGTVYLSPSPGAKPFVVVGQYVKIGDVMCLIESMKMPNQIKADKAGKVTAILIDNGSPIDLIKFYPYLSNSYNIIVLRILSDFEL